MTVNLYKSLRSCKDYGLKDQVTRAAVSIPSNIAEGFERNSNKQFAHYLQIAKGSCGELRSQLYICSEIGVPDTKVAREYRLEAVEISNMLSGLIKRFNACYIEDVCLPCADRFSYVLLLWRLA